MMYPKAKSSTTLIELTSELDSTCFLGGRTLRCGRTNQTNTEERNMTLYKLEYEQRNEVFVEANNADEAYDLINEFTTNGGTNMPKYVWLSVVGQS